VITIDVVRKHSLAKTEARRVADSLTKELEGLLGISGIAGEWIGDTLHLLVSSGPAQGTTGEVALSDGAVRVTLRLSTAPSMMRKTIQAGVTHFLKKALPR
jgi:putative polyhydroxyalkanoate system protein